MTPKQLKAVLSDVRPKERGRLLALNIALFALTIIGILALSINFWITVAIFVLSAIIERRSSRYFSSDPKLLSAILTGWVLIFVCLGLGLYILINPAPLANYVTDGAADATDFMLIRSILGPVFLLLIPVTYRQYYLDIKNGLRSKKVKGMKPDDLFK